MRHCRNAVHNTETQTKNSTDMTNGKLYKNKTRIVSSNNCVNGESASWRLDYYKFKGLTFAQILSKTLKNSNPSNQNVTNQVVSSNKHSMSITTVPSTCDSGARCTKSKMGVNKRIWAPTRDRVSHDVNAGQATSYNRYEVLYQGDSVISQTPDTVVKHVHHTHIPKENDAITIANIKPDSSKHENMSFNDACLNPGKNPKSKVQLQKQREDKVLWTQICKIQANMTSLCVLRTKLWIIHRSWLPAPPFSCGTSRMHSNLVLFPWVI